MLELDCFSTARAVKNRAALNAGAAGLPVPVQPRLLNLMALLAQLNPTIATDVTMRNGAVETGDAVGPNIPMAVGVASVISAGSRLKARF